MVHVYVYIIYVHVHVHVQFSLIDLWLRTDVTASWSKLAAALDEAGEEAAAGKIKEQYLGIPASSPIPPAVVAATGAAGVGRAGAGLGQDW